MGKDPKITTTVSTKGQVVLPAAVRKRLGWDAGTQLVVEETPQGVLLKGKSLFGPPTRPEDVFGMLKYNGPPVSIEEMDKAIETEVLRRHARGRY
ncbi:MAG TPA: AbrB/MazE/SpoVT family DNA-binding domain-containing protein [Rhodanobacteraceae bacterium]